MLRRLGATVTLAGAISVIATMPALGNGRSCGTVPIANAKASVRVARGSISCTRARAVIKMSETPGRGTSHNLNRGNVQIYTTFPGHWSCSSLEHGNWACWRGGSVSTGAGASIVIDASYVY